MLFMYMYFSFLLVVLGRNYAIYICHFDNLDVFFVSFQNRERVHSSEKQRKWRSDRTKGKVQFVRCFYGNIDQWVISQKIVKLSELQCNFTSYILLKRNFGVFLSWKFLWSFFATSLKNIAYGNENSRELTKIMIKNESIYFLFESYGLDMFCFFPEVKNRKQIT